jgi:hypothetical protein
MNKVYIVATSRYLESMILDYGVAKDDGGVEIIIEKYEMEYGLRKVKDVVVDPQDNVVRYKIQESWCDDWDDAVMVLFTLPVL